MIWGEKKIDSSEREVRVIEGSSYRESTVAHQHFRRILICLPKSYLLPVFGYLQS